MLKNWDSKGKHSSEKYRAVHPAHSVGGMGCTEKDQDREGNGKWQQKWEENARLTSCVGQEPGGAPPVRYDKTFGSISQL